MTRTVEFTVWGKLPTAPDTLAFDFHVSGWKDWDDNVHTGRPSKSTGSDGVQGVYVHSYDLDTGEDHWFWVHSYLRLGSWEEWLDVIGLTMEMHGMSLA